MTPEGCPSGANGCAKICSLPYLAATWSEYGAKDRDGLNEILRNAVKSYEVER